MLEHRVRNNKPERLWVTIKFQPAIILNPRCHCDLGFNCNNNIYKNICKDYR